MVQVNPTCVSPYAAPLGCGKAIIEVQLPSYAQDGFDLVAHQKLGPLDDTVSDPSPWKLVHRDPGAMREIFEKARWLDGRRQESPQREGARISIPLDAGAEELVCQTPNKRQIQLQSTNDSRFPGNPAITQIMNRRQERTGGYRSLARFFRRAKDLRAQNFKEIDQRFIQQAMIIYEAPSVQMAYMRLAERGLTIHDLDENLFEECKRTCLRMVKSISEVGNDLQAIKTTFALRRSTHIQTVRDFTTVLRAHRVLTLIHVDEICTPSIGTSLQLSTELLFTLFPLVTRSCKSIAERPLRSFRRDVHAIGCAKRIRVCLTALNTRNLTESPEVRAEIPITDGWLKTAQEALSQTYDLENKPQQTRQRARMRPEGPLRRPRLPADRQIHHLMVDFGIEKDRIQKFKTQILPHLSTATLLQALTLYDLLEKRHSKGSLLRILATRGQARPHGLAFAIETILRHHDKFRDLEHFVDQYQMQADIYGKLNGFHFELRVVAALDNLAYAEIHEIGGRVGGKEIDVVVRVNGNLYFIESKRNVTKNYAYERKTKAQVLEQAGISQSMGAGYLIVIREMNTLSRSMKTHLHTNYIPYVTLDELKHLDEESFEMLAS